MTATVIDLRARRGRPSAARLAELLEQAADGRDEVLALADERRIFAQAVLGLARIAEVQLAAGRAPATILDELERLALQELTRATTAVVALRAGDACPDGVEERRAGHGAAA